LANAAIRGGTRSVVTAFSLLAALSVVSTPVTFAFDALAGMGAVTLVVAVGPEQRRLHYPGDALGFVMAAAELTRLVKGKQ
jgi:hypothetical protein